MENVSALLNKHLCFSSSTSTEYPLTALLYYMCQVEVIMCFKNNVMVGKYMLAVHS